MFKKFKAKTTIFAIVSSLLLSACSVKDYNNKDILVLENSKFEALELNGIEVKKSEKVANINFDKEQKVFGNLGCNNFFGSYKQEKNNLTIGQVGSTMMMCQDMQTEQNFLNVLENVKTFKLENSTLELFNQNGKNIAKFRKKI